jgi:hypothetical protein
MNKATSAVTYSHKLFSHVPHKTVQGGDGDITMWVIDCDCIYLPKKLRKTHQVKITNCNLHSSFVCVMFPSKQCKNGGRVQLS